MTSKPSQDQESRRAQRGRGVLDPAWEEELERGREADEEAPDAGSIEPELAMLHLLRHAREPEALSGAELDALWSDIDQAVSPASESWTTRWRSAFSLQWAKWAVPLAGAAALVVMFQSAPEDAAPGSTVAMNQAERSAESEAGVVSELAAQDEKAAAESPGAGAAEKANEAPARSAPSSTAALLEQQFSMLEGRGRAQVDSNVQSQRTSLRSALIGQAKGGAQ